MGSKSLNRPIVSAYPSPPIFRIAHIMNLDEIVKSDILGFFDAEQELFFNENDFQMHLAIYLRTTGHYDDVDVEYYIPYAQLKDYIWKNELYLDIVVEKNGEFLPIELKYPTSKVSQKIKRFGEQLSDEVVIVKSQGAQDIVQYNIWKDVRRIELIRNRFSAVKNGLSVVLTNNKSYLVPHRKGSNALNLSVEAGHHGRDRHWLHDSAITPRRPGFDLDQEYEVQWHDCKLRSSLFHYCIIKI